MKEIKFFDDSLKGNSPATRRNYVADVMELKEWSDKKGLGPIKNLKDIDITNYRTYLTEKRLAGKLSATSINRKLSAIRTFYNVLSDNNIIDYIPTTKLRSVKAEKKVKETLEIDDIEQVLPHLKDIRERVIFELLFKCGIRREELVTLERNKIRFNKGYMVVMGKGGKEREVPLEQTTIQWLQRHLETHNSKWVFPSQNSSTGHIDGGTVYSIVRRWGKAINVDLTPHVFRHSCLTHLYRNNFDLLQLKDFAGHERVETTSIYATVSNKKMRDDFRNVWDKSRLPN